MERTYKFLNHSEFAELLFSLSFNKEQINVDYFYDRYMEVLDVYDLIASQNKDYALQNLDNMRLVLYLVNDFFYRLTLQEGNKDIESDEFVALLVNSVVDKYAADVHFKYDPKRLMTPFFPPVSTINVFTNFILKKLELFEKQEPQKTLVIDMLNKSFSLIKAITTLLVNGFETEAFTTWRTMHELEATLTILTKYGEDVIKGYLTHMRYGDAYNKVLPQDVCDEIFIEIKEAMKSFDLKSKDTKRFIEYGWLRFVPGIDKDNLKFNFRDGLETIAGLQDYNRMYQMASEVNHSSPVLIYSRRDLFAMLTIINLYDSFFRLENIFRGAYFAMLSLEERKHYDQVRSLYYFEMKRIQHNEVERLKQRRKKVAN
jgi:hypothetical protein